MKNKLITFSKPICFSYFDNKMVEQSSLFDCYEDRYLSNNNEVFCINIQDLTEKSKEKLIFILSNMLSEKVSSVKFKYPKCNTCAFFMEFGGCPNLEQAQKTDPVKNYTSSNYFCADHSDFEK